MNFPEEGRASARKFLEYFLSRQTRPASAEELPASAAPGQAVMSQEEIEAECMDVSRKFLANCSCPGLLNYNITAAAVETIMRGPLEPYKEQQGEEEEEQQGAVHANGDETITAQKYNGKLLALATVQSVHDICNKWSQELGKLTCARKRPEISLHSIRNARRKMEDRHAICIDVNTLYGLTEQVSCDQSFFGVYDGHIGAEAADYASRHVHHNIIRHPLFVSDPVSAIREGIRITDERFCTKACKAGTTAVVALLRGDKLYIGWVGDSQSVLVRRGEAVEVMSPHKPDREDEQRRIEEAGGLVINIGVWRVNGNLSVSRAIGDAKEKKYVIGEAEVSTIDLDGNEDYLVVACDGIWDVVDWQELTECVSNHFVSGGKKCDAAKTLVNFARTEGSGDNLTAIIVYFNTFNPPPSSASGTETAKTETSTTQTETGTAKNETNIPRTETSATGTETNIPGTETSTTGTETGTSGTETNAEQT